MLDETAINKLPTTLVLELTASIQQNQAIHRPKLPYCAWRVISDVSQGLGSFSYEDAVSGEVNEKIEDSQLATIEFNFYSDTTQNVATKEAREICNEFLRKLKFTSTRNVLAAAGITILNKKDYSNLDEHLGDDWERRAMCELTINYIDSVNEEIGFADTIETTGTIINIDGTELV